MLSPHLVERALESAPDAIVICDLDGCIVFANAQVEVLFGYGGTELLGRSVDLLLPERFHNRHLSHRAAFAFAPRARPMGAGLALRARRKDGTEFPVEISLSPIRGGGRTLVAAAVRDAGDRERIEAELRSAREAADRANRAKSRFLATASHDLRQPLQTLSLLNGTLRRLPTDHAVAEALAQQEQAITAMSRLINALLDVSKLESGAIRPEITDFNVASIFEEMHREFASVAASKGLQLEVEACGDTVRSDPSLIEQILRNLVANAVRYTNHGRVLLRCLREREPAMVRLEVLDSGIGIPADEVPYIFEEFYQAGAQPSTRREGYGLGLSIVNRLVGLLGLALEVQSEVGKGSSFRLFVPAGRGTVPVADAFIASETPRDHGRPAAARRVLLVEDDTAVRDATRLLLETGGYDVVTAASCAEALERLEEPPSIELLVTDYHLGGETGMQVIAAARRRVGAHLRAILVSGDTSPVVRDLELERDEHLRIVSKPIQAERLLALVAELLERDADR